MTNINFDVDDYTDNELLDIAEISQDASSEVIDEKFTEIIKQYLDSKNFRLAQFFHDAKEKVLKQKKNRYVKSKFIKSD